MGKLTERIEVQVSEEAKHSLIALAAARRMTLSEYVRKIIYRSVFGELQIMQVALDASDPPTISRGIPGIHRDE